MKTIQRILLPVLSVKSFCPSFFHASWLLLGLFYPLMNVSSHTMADFKLPREVIYIQFDRKIYTSGECIHYKSYVRNATNLKASELSKVQYFELISPSNLPVVQWKSVIKMGEACGKIIIPDTLPSGIYTIRSYTQWMRNFPDYFYFSGQLLILSTSGNVPDSIPAPEDNFSHDFRVQPEGRSWFETDSSRIFYRIPPAWIKSNNQGIQLLKLDGSLVSTIPFPSAGIGSFYFIPEKNQLYFLQARDEKGTTHTKEIRPDLARYCNLHVEQFNHHVVLQCKKKANSLDHFFITISNRGKELLRYQLPAGQEKFSITIPDSILSPGIQQIRLWEGGKIVRAERLVFLENRDNTASISVEKDTFFLGQEIEPRLEGRIVSKSLLFSGAASISLENIPAFLQNTGIFYTIQLYSELKNIPFICGKPKIPLSDLDVWIASASAEEYSWKDNNEIIPEENRFIPETHGFLLSGRVLNLSHKNPVAGEKLLLMSPDSVAQLAYTTTDNSGHFCFALNEKWENRKLIVQLERKEENVQWKLDAKYDSLPAKACRYIRLDEGTRRYCGEVRDFYLIQRIYYGKIFDSVDANINHPLPEFPFYGKAGYTVYPSEFLELPDFKEVSSNLLPGVRYHNREGEGYIQIFDPETHEVWPGEKRVLLNGVFTDDLDYIAAFNSKRIHSIQVIPSYCMYGDLSFQGILSLRTYDMLLPEKWLEANTVTFENVIQPYTSNIYLARIPGGKEAITLPSFQRLLWWNPALSDKNLGEAVRMQTPQIQGPLRIVLEGITAEGQPFSMERTVQLSRSQSRQ